MTSDPEELEVERDELQAATQHLTRDFLCHVIQEEGQGKRPEDAVIEQKAEQEQTGVGSPQQAAPLAVILGKLPRAASLSLQHTFQTFSELKTGQVSGKKRNCSMTSLLHRSTGYRCYW